MKRKYVGHADGSVDIGLDCLRAIQKPGQTFTTRDIARVCGCSRGLVFLWEQQALKKIRDRMRRELGQSFEEFYGADRNQLSKELPKYSS